VPAAETFRAFLLAALVLVLVPGPAVLFVTARSLRHGPRAGVTSAAAVAAGNAVHVLVAAAGLSTLLAASATAFTVVKLAGAAYLAWLSFTALRGGLRRGHDAVAGRGDSRPRVWRDGFVVALLNPKTALFFLAFLPLFVDPARGPAGPQVAVLGAVLVGVGLVTDSCYAVLAGRIGSAVAGSGRARQARERVAALVTGTVYGALAVVALRAGRAST
jgi:threonine/homoserine/homoserine lactone efflux protein